MAEYLVLVNHFHRSMRKNGYGKKMLHRLMRKRQNRLIAWKPYLRNWRVDPIGHRRSTDQKINCHVWTHRNCSDIRLRCCHLQYEKWVGLDSMMHGRPTLYVGNQSRRRRWRNDWVIWQRTDRMITIELRLLMYLIICTSGWKIFNSITKMEEYGPQI